MSNHPYTKALFGRKKPVSFCVFIQKGESTNPPSKRAVWKSHEEAELVHSLLEVKRAGGTSNIGFKDKVWNSVSAHLTEECGTVFKPSACKNKYGKLKQIYWAIKRLSEQSGFLWSNENGADRAISFC
ncbi:uncharacterized protein EI90DRAFT_3021981 [Cantharellus anzutake]|uniref:uncharacterized protein n=1 Tax=Cantharellus anzutake TaxID=1750568 RepID=UPI001903882C|nr:uncharacterized protein EI90DRAFT_3021981 [Cantharellus anzutake]KAF8315292.1 hypothetical protein EI90DRAFT_3021981 [Cantharellus anzutake]